MAAYRYWRCSRIRGQHSAYGVIGCSKIEFRTSGGTDQTTGGMALAWGYWGDAFVSSSIFASTPTLPGEVWYCPYDTPVNAEYQHHAAWIGYQFSSAVDIATVAVAPVGAGGIGGDYWLSCNVDASNDGVVWSYVGRCAFSAPSSSSDQSLRSASIQPVPNKLRVDDALVTQCGAAPSAPQVWVRAPRRMNRDIDGGLGVITGSVSGIGPPVTPLARRVMLIDERTRRVVRETWSDSSGAYTFEGLDPLGTYTALCHDSAGVYRAVAADRLVPTAT